MPFNDKFKTRQMLFNAVPPAVKVPQAGMEINGPLPVQQPIIPQERTRQPMNLDEATTPSLDSYRQLLSAPPTYDQYKPSKWRRAAAAFVGAGEGLTHGGAQGAASARQIVDAPYTSALNDYNNRVTYAGHLADVEGADIKRKLEYIKTVKDDDRADRVADTDIRNKESQIKQREAMTPAQVEHLAAMTKTAGVRYEQNKKDGHFYKFDKDGTKTDMGAFDLTPEQTSALDVKEFGQKEGIKFKNDKDLFSFEQPIKDKSATTVHQTNRMTDAAHPIPQSSFDATQPSQYDIADKTAVREVIRGNPGYAKFAVDDVNSIKKAYDKDPTGYADYLTLVKKAKSKILEGSAKRPMVTVPGQSPLSSPNGGNDPHTQEAIDQLKKDGQPQTPEMINFVKKQLHPELY